MLEPNNSNICRRQGLKHYVTWKSCVEKNKNLLIEIEGNNVNIKDKNEKD